MRISRLGERLGALLLAVAVLSVLPPAQAAPLAEPVAEPTYRDLRDDYVKTWYIYNDESPDGILDPADTRVETFQNWWTATCTYTQHNYGRRGQGLNEDWSSAPVNMASATDPLANYWLDRPDNTLSFYMTYSQYDNNAWKGGTYTGGKSGEALEILQGRNASRNGYALGWLTNTIDNAQDKTTADGAVKMDVFTHNAQMDLAVGGAWGGATSYSDPQVAVSNDISNKAIDNVGASGQWHALQFDGSLPAGTGTYTWAANKTRLEWNGQDQADLADIADSMEVKEWDPLNATWATEAVDPTKTPAQVAAGEVDHNGAAYVYEDAFRDRCALHEGATDGGVIAGLSGYDNYSAAVNNWGDQQVIRIDIDEATLAAGNIDQLIFWDFGGSIPGATGTQQTNPAALVFGIDRTRTVAQGQIFYDDGLTKTYFPDNRIYIATAHIPEPGTLALCLLGGLGLICRRRRRGA